MGNHRQRVRTEIVESREADDLDVIRQGMRAHISQHVAWESSTDLTVYVRDEHGVLLGAFLGETGRGWLHIDVLWVSEAFRRQGLGTQLLKTGESEAQRRGCNCAYLDTFDYQAPSFYGRLGYEIFGTLDEYPAGHKRYFMRKTLRSADL